jgi:predicted ATPase
LFVERCGLVRPGYQPGDEDLATIVSICIRVDGMPLAIELAAARTRVMSLEEVSAGLSARFRLLTGGGRALVPRQQTLRASVDWSYSLLDEQERAVLRRRSPAWRPQGSTGPTWNGGWRASGPSTPTCWPRSAG